MSSFAAYEHLLPDLLNSRYRRHTLAHLIVAIHSSGLAADPLFNSLA